MKKLIPIASSTVALINLFSGSSAFAQSVDYGSLEAVFGEPVTTSATGLAQRVSEVPADMTIITADEIRQSGSRNIPEILSNVPGLDILRSGVGL
jgi:iron complex outermembrane receptor protein